MGHTFMFLQSKVVIMEMSKVTSLNAKVVHMWLMGCSNPSKFEQSLESTFLKVFTHMNSK